MNERFWELVGQAFDAVWDLDKTTTGPSTHFVPDGFEQKFAELIVKECADVANQHMEHNEGTDYNVGGKIKQHFGVES